MQNIFFTEKENLISIIEKKFKNINKVSKISTGWTNIVLEVENDNTPYIVRFPRNDFFSKQIEKDVFVNQFLKKEINLKTVNMELCFDNERPFSIHKKILGNSLTERLNYLSKNKIEKITEEVALFFSTIHNIPQNKIPNEIKNIKLSKFLTELSKVDDNYYDYSSLVELEKNEKKESVLCHGDLNIGNIILDEKDEIIAFLDFSFASMSTREADLSRISCRVSEEFLNLIIKNYEKQNSIKIDMEKLNECNSMWNYVEEQYIVYMKKYQPEIKLPEGI